MAKPWGWHLALDCHQAEPASIRSKEHIESFAKELVKEIEMVAFGKPQIVHFGKDDKCGYTLVQLIETSNICAHFAEDTNSFFLDVFSCKPFEQSTVIEVVSKYFNPKTINTHFFERY